MHGQSAQEMPYIHYTGNRYRFSENLKALFENLVKQPFQNHPLTPAWDAEVRNKDLTYHSKVILDQGRTDFNEPYNGLSPQDKVLIYCSHYMPMHLVSSYHIFRIHTPLFTTHLRCHSDRIVFIDFGCGPLTSGVAFWAFAKQDNIIYLGIDTSQAMLDKAKEINHYGPNKYKAPFYKTFEGISNYSELPRILERYISTNEKTPIIFNFCYFLASRTLDVSSLSNVINQIVKKYSKHRMCAVYQNPDLSSLHENWEILRNNFTGFRSRVIESSVQWFRYDSLTTDSLHNANVYNDILCNE